MLEHQTVNAGLNGRDDEQNAQARVGRRDATLSRLLSRSRRRSDQSLA